jgi:hypothetical protein
VAVTDAEEIMLKGIFENSFISGAKFFLPDFSSRRRLSLLLSFLPEEEWSLTSGVPEIKGRLRF